MILKFCEDLDPKKIIEYPEHMYLIHWSILLPDHQGKCKFIFQLVKVAHKIQNELFLIYILSLHYFSLWVTLTTSYLEQYKNLKNWY